MKNYLDIGQCNSIMEKLSPDTADMHYDIAKSMAQPVNGKYCKLIDTEVPCWSAGALSDILSQQAEKDRCTIFIKKDVKWTVNYIKESMTQLNEHKYYAIGDNIVDALYDMLMKVLS